MVTLSTGRSRNPDIDNPLTLTALGVLAATLAAVAHEAVGHGGACLASGAQVVRLTALFFRCSVGSDLTDVAGPVGSLACGAAAAVLLRWGWAWGVTARVFLLTLSAITLFWFFGQLARDAAFGTDDWAFASLGVRRWTLVVIGVLGYIATLRLCVGAARAIGGGWRRFLIPYAAAAGSAVIAGLLWRGHVQRAALEGLLTLGLAPVGYLWALRAALRRPANIEPEVVRGDGPWIAAAIVVYTAFLLTMARGLGPLA
jgi:hypothetical protein